ncbi:hypothetical protein [Hydrogenophaga palleronii]|uniref:hypothetical protein n=1 Tax=Hydrogenophaga palleronii TaxID=65655 RepID=UPI000825E256|nr:hypothetical protein [Hydrogenophaga palleronii]
MKNAPLALAQVWLSSVLLVGCADMTAFQQLMGQDESKPRLAPEQLKQKCVEQEKINSWTTDCLDWAKARDDSEAAKRRSDAQALAAARETELMARRELERQRLREEEVREKAAVQEDERAGYKHLSFEDFALDAAKMQGTKVAVYGVYVGKGKRLASSQLAALMWTERAHSIPSALIPLVTTEATRDSRSMLLHCDASPMGCGVVVRGRIRMLTLQNAFGAVSRDLGVVVESVR